MEENRTAEGFLFLNEADAELARQEKKKVEYLEKHMDYRSAEMCCVCIRRPYWSGYFGHQWELSI